MRPTDNAVLEFLRNEGNREIVATPSVIAANIDYAERSVQDRMMPLRKAGLVQYEDERAGRYEITDLARRYLDGNLDDEEIAELESTLGDF